MPMTHEALPPDRLLARCDPSSLGFATTAELATSVGAVGQDRAVEAIALAIDVRLPGYNLFVIGPTGSGRSTIVRSHIERHAATQPTPDDYCYVYNFDEPRRPRGLRLPPGQGTRLRDHLDRLVEELQAAIPAMFESESYRDRREAIERELNQRHEQEMNAIVEDAAKRGVGVLRTSTGVVLAPMRDGQVLDPEQQEKLEPAERARLAEQAEQVHERLHEALQRVPELQREQRDRVKRLDQEVMRSVAQSLLAEIRRAFSEHPAVIEHVQAIERDVVEKSGQLLRAQSTEEGMPRLGLDGSHSRESPIVRRFRANLVVDHRLTTGAPVIEVGHPTSGALVGKVEHVAQLGVMITDFNLIKAGALHQASGGYLVVDARRLLMQPVAFEQLKRTLREGAIRIESVPEALDLTVGVSLEPEAIPFTGKVVLIGESWLYHRLSALDPELAELFKVAAEFETDMPRTTEGCRAYASLLARVIKQERLLAMDAMATARLIEVAARDAEDSTRLSMHVGTTFDLLREAHHVAKAASHELIERSDVQRAFEARERRHGRLRDRVQQAITEGTLSIATDGDAIGQINGLSVMSLPTARFGFPSRITARVRLGKGEVIDIEREIELGGPLHSKGVLILAAALGSRYLVDKPLALHASIVFEQSHGFVDGDSASLAELLALLSAIGELPVAQSIAVTGAIDQHGRVQAIGGVNEKIEGFYDVCARRAGEGPYGVIVPSTNVRHLMLRDDVVAAAERGAFRVFAVDDVDQALEIMTGLVAGARAPGAVYPEGTANRRIEDRLERLGAAALAAARLARPDDSKT